MIQCSYFAGSHKPTKIKDVNLIDFLKTDYFKDDIEAIRNGDTSKKRNLPGITPNAVFDTYRAKAMPHTPTGVLFVDIDGKSQTYSAKVIKELFTALSQTIAVRYSSSGNGVHAFINIGGNSLESCYLTMKKILTEVGVEIDHCKDYARMCLASYDADVYVNEHATVLQPYPDEMLYPPKVEYKTSYPTSTDIVGDYQRYCQRRESGFVSGNRNQWIYERACAGKLTFLLDKSQVEEVLMKYATQGFTNELQAAIRSAYKN